MQHIAGNQRASHVNKGQRQSSNRDRLKKSNQW